MGKILYLLHLISSLVFIGLFGAPAYSVPDWFAGKRDACNAAVPGPLLAQAPLANFGASWGSPWNNLGYNLQTNNLNKTSAPGDGKCCIFDSSGNMIGATRLTDGDNECERILRASSAGQSCGIYWCVGKESDCHVDWWFKTK